MHQQKNNHAADISIQLSLFSSQAQLIYTEVRVPNTINSLLVKEIYRAYVDQNT